MSLEHAILGFLHYGPTSGYHLKARFDSSVTHFWSADQSQIYRVLARIAQEGWATIEIVEQDDHPDRKVYHITPAGRDELRRWLSEPLPYRVQRSARLIQLFFSGQLEDAEILKILRRQLDDARTSLAQLRGVPGKVQLPDTVPGDDRYQRERFFWMLTLDNGLALTEAQVSWLERTIARIEKGEYSSKNGAALAAQGAKLQ